MNYIIFDLEWNQGVSHGDKREKRMPLEIVEIGAVKLNEDREMISEFSELIKPQIYHEIHNITRKIIHIQMEELQKGKPFEEVMPAFLEWCGEDSLFCTWGGLDLLELQRNMAYYNMPPLSDRPIKFYDIQKLFSLAYEDGKSRRSLEYAIDMLDIKKDIPFHRAFSDAYYTAKVFDKIEDPDVLERFSFDIYTPPSSREKEVEIIFSDYCKVITQTFPDKKALLSTKYVCQPICYRCRRRLARRLKWFSPNGKHYYSVAYCFKHGFMKSKLRIKKTEDSQVFAVITHKFITKEERKLLLEWRDELLKKKQSNLKQSV
ncbi:MAG: exonuclease domain-containing protein [Lachnospiraceae bacterium]|nr:exonuclease domain-containing protein [Lachnospiraceae bacterium]